MPIEHPAPCLWGGNEGGVFRRGRGVRFVTNLLLNIGYYSEKVEREHNYQLSIVNYQFVAKQH